MTGIIRHWSYDLEKHPFGGPYIPHGSTHLVIGTFPTYWKNRLFRFYYSGVGNMFWRVIDKVFMHKFYYHLKGKAAKERKEFLDHSKFGIMDMHHICYRRNKESQDHNLYPVILTDIHEILENNPKVTDLIFTSRTDGVGALGLFNNYLIQRGKQALILHKDDDGLRFGDYKLNGKNYEVWVPYSPSESSEASKKLGVDGLAKMYRKCFDKIAPK